MKRLAKWLVPLSAVAALHAQPAVHDPFNDPFFQDPFGDDIFKEMMMMQRQMDELFKRMQMRIHQRHMAMPTAAYAYAMQSGFVDKGDHYELYTHIPESKDNEINIKTGNGTITITARIVHEEKQNNNGFISTSRSEQVMHQTLTLPADADENKIDTEFQKGMLVVKIGKKPKIVTSAQPASNNKPSVTIQTPATAIQAKQNTSQATQKAAQPKEAEETKDQKSETTAPQESETH